MAHHTEQAGFPPIPLQPGMRLRLRALSPTTDTAVTGVTASQWSIYGRDEGEGGSLMATIPGWTAEEVVEEAPA